MTSPDYLIFGLGPAGCAAAVFAAQAGASVILAGLPPKGLRFGEYLPPEANPLITELRVTLSTLSCSGVRSWWNGAESVQESLFHPLGEARFVNRPDFEVTLLDKARELGVRILEGAHLHDRSGKRVSLSGGDVFTPRTVIDATGRPAAVARQFGVGRQRVDRLTAVGARIPSSHPDRSLLIEAVGTGWWYTCPLPGGKRSVVFLTDSDLPQFEKARTAGGWRELIGPRIEEIVGDSEPEEMAVAPADSACLASTGGEGWTAIGDAAMSFDPLASRGLCHALASGREAVLGERNPPGRFESYLQEKQHWYRQERRFQGEPFWERRLV